jgi:hypothetical protein
MVETRTMRTYEFAGDKLVPRLFAKFTPGILGIFTQVENHLVILIQQRHPRSQVGHHHIAIFEDIEMARQIHSAHEIDVFAVERKTLQAVIGAVGDHQNRRWAAQVADNSMWARDLARLRA